MKFELVLVACAAVANAEEFEVGIEMGLSEGVNKLPKAGEVLYKLNGDDDFTELSQDEIDELRARTPHDPDDGHLFYDVGTAYTNITEDLTGDIFEPVKDSVGLDYCLLTGEKPTKTGFNEGQLPKFCNFDWGNERCCSTTQDVYIKNSSQLDHTWTAECKEKKIPKIKELFCFPCDPRQPYFTDYDKKLYRICESLIRDVYMQDDLNAPPEKLEGCGLWHD